MTVWLSNAILASSNLRPRAASETPANVSNYVAVKVVGVAK